MHRERCVQPGLIKEMNADGFNGDVSRRFRWLPPPSLPPLLLAHRSSLIVPPLHVHAAPRPGAVRVVQTMGNVPHDFYVQSRLINHSIAIEPEGGGGGVINGVSTGNWATMGWGYCETLFR
jgi:hypothetical protein